MSRRYATTSAIRCTCCTTLTSQRHFDCGFTSSEASILSKLLPRVAFLFCAATVVAQSAPSTTTPPSHANPARRGGEPCWQQAGIEKSVAQEIWFIGRDARSQIQGVCSNSSLTPQQKRQQVQEIRHQAMQKREALITADQRNTFMACQQTSSGNHPSGSSAHEGLGGGCGEMLRGARKNGTPNGAQNNGTSSAPQSNQSAQQN